MKTLSTTICLFTAIYDGMFITVNQNVNGRFDVTMAYDYDYSTATTAETDFYDVIETVEECLNDAANCECKCVFQSHYFKQQMQVYACQAYCNAVNNGDIEEVI